MTSVAVRSATVGDFVAIYGNAEHFVGTVDDVPAAYISFRRIDGRLWGMFGVLAPIDRRQVHTLFFRMRRYLTDKTEPVYGLAQDAGTERLVCLMGLQPTAEVYAGKKVYIWIPEHSSS